MAAVPAPDASKPPLEKLSDYALLSDFGELVRQDHRRVASLLRHIDVIDRRKLWARQGHPSLFDFLVRRYHMSESTAGKRIGAARTARRFPIVFSMVERGEIHLSGIHRLKAHLTPENHEAVLAAAKHKTMREIDELVAHLAPQPDVPSTLRALPRRPDPAARTLPASTPALQVSSPALPALDSVVPTPSKAAGSPCPATPSIPAISPVAAKPPPRSPDPAPISPGRYKLQVTLGQAAKDKLKQLQDLLAHQIPSGDPAAIVERALDALLIQVHKRKTGITAKPQAGQSTRELSRQPHEPSREARRELSRQPPEPSREARRELSRDSSDEPTREARRELSRDSSDQPSRDSSDEPSRAARNEPSRDSNREPRPNPTATRRRRRLKVSARREVWPRDNARCGFIGENGRRCNETRGLEFAHVHPWAKGGADTADNLGLRCILCRMRHKMHYAEYGFMPHGLAKSHREGPIDASYAA